MAIQFFSLTGDIKYQNINALKSWIKEIIEDYNKLPGKISIIIVSDVYLLDLNRTYLKKDCFTDIITFNFNEGKYISGDLYISIDRINENANTYAVSSSNELLRVIIHGILHLIGLNDRSDAEIDQMQQAEELALKKAKGLETLLF